MSETKITKKETSRAVHFAIARFLFRGICDGEFSSEMATAIVNDEIERRLVRAGKTRADL